MPMVDGVQATKMIRAIERVKEASTTEFSPVRPTTDDPQKGAIKHYRPPTPYPSGESLKLLEAEGVPIAPLPMGLRRSAILEVSDPSSPSKMVTPSPSPQKTSPPTVQHQPSSSSSTFYITTPRQSQQIHIFAVSANLDQYSQESLQAAGFDGSLPKPIDFARLGLLLKGSSCVESRVKGRYNVEDARAGGWYK